MPRFTQQVSFEVEIPDASGISSVCSWLPDTWKFLGTTVTPQAKSVRVSKEGSQAFVCVFLISPDNLFDKDSQVYQMGSVWRTYTLKNLKTLSRAKKNDRVLSYKISLHLKEKGRFVGLK